jgi:glycosyltransferase involved in cell wall biosynthesis
MNIGFDAKRAFHNGTGLGHYSRTLLQSLSQFYPEHHYYLFNPKKSNRFQLEGHHFHEVRPRSLFHKLFSSAWRSSWVKSDLKQNHINLYHGLSHEIPVGINRTGIPSVVTIHDLIHERYPEQYNAIDVRIYNKKFRYACEHASHIIAISEQTRQDIISFYSIPESRISVCYQSCNPAFGLRAAVTEKAAVKAHYRLPENYFLYVGSIIERKNLLNICKAMYLLRSEISTPLVVIGDGNDYKRKVQDYVKQNGLEEKIIFLSDQAEAKTSASFRNAKDFPAIYQSAIAMIYPSFFEGFGIPVLEALMSRLPVITSNVSCLPEAGGPGAHYVDPNNAAEIAEAMKRISIDPVYAAAMVEKGIEHAAKFSTDRTAAGVMEVYRKVVGSS